MEEYTNNHLSESTGPSPRAGFLYTSVGGSSVHQLPINTFHHLQSGGSDHCFQSDQVPQHPAVKTESSQLHTQIFHYPLMRGNLHHTLHHPHPPSQQQQQQGGSQNSNEVEAIKAKIIAHPQYSNLLEAYMDCQKVVNN